eukprot:148158-Chlamydomonas_euryale.AAC.1
MSSICAHEVFPGVQADQRRKEKLQREIEDWQSLGSLGRAVWVGSSAALYSSMTLVWAAFSLLKKRRVPMHLLPLYAETCLVKGAQDTGPQNSVRKVPVLGRSPSGTDGEGNICSGRRAHLPSPYLPNNHAENSRMEACSNGLKACTCI